MVNCLKRFDGKLFASCTDEVLRGNNINLYVNVIGSCEDFVKDSSNESVTSLVIPLTNKTVAIDITNNLVNKSDNVMVCSKPSAINIFYLIISLIVLAMDITLIVNLIILDFLHLLLLLLL